MKRIRRSVGARDKPAVAARASSVAKTRSGMPLPDASRRYLGTAFGHDFAAVRVHCDRDADADAVAIGARAFTLGEDLYLRSGEYAPETRSGRRLLAHELAHVVQARRAGATTPASSPARSESVPAEQEARRAGALAGSGLPVGRLTMSIAGPALTPTSDAIESLTSYSLGDWAVTEPEEARILVLLKADPDLSRTVLDLALAGMLGALLDRVDEPVHRRDLLRLFGARLNPATLAMVQKVVVDLALDRGQSPLGAQVQLNLGRLGVSAGAALFNPYAHSDLVSEDGLAPFSGVGATGVNPSDRGYIDWAGAGSRAFDRDLNAIGDLGGYLSGLTPDQRRRQVELLVRRPISTFFVESYAGLLPSRLQVMKALGAAHRLEPELIAAIILAEQRDQSRAEDARDFIGALVLGKNTSIGLGQVVGSTATKHDLFADLLTVRKDEPLNLAWLLASDEVNIAATARYLRMVADQGATLSLAALPNTKALFPGLDLTAYANHSSAWPEDNIGALGMYYTSRPWTDNVNSAGWGWFVMQAYRDVKAAAVF